MYEYFKDSLAKFPIKETSLDQQITIKELVDNIFATSKDNII